MHTVTRSFPKTLLNDVHAIFVQIEILLLYMIMFSGYSV
jgi:hypothetical protein